MSKKKRIIDAIYSCSPMQQGMLFHTLYDARAGVYIEQTSLTLQGDLAVPAFQRAWRQVVARHTIFRTAFIWEHRDEPLQAVYRDVRLPWVEEDWRDLSLEVQETRLAAFITEDRNSGFVLSQAPLMRLALFRVAADVYHLIWSSHHLLIDGWSVPLVLNEVFACYDAFVRDQELDLPQPRPYRDYIIWLKQQDLAAAESFWRKTLAGFRAPTRLGVDHPFGPNAEAVRYASYEIQLTETTSTALQVLVRQHGLTLNTVVQGAWALLLSCYSGERDVVFGAIVAGRPPDLAGVENMIGVFINTVPVRTHIRPDAALLSWLESLQTQQVEARQYEYVSLVQVQGWSEVPRGLPLFESIIVFENHLAATVGLAPGDHASLTIRDLRGIEQNNYPITLIARPDQGLALQISYDCRRFDAVVIERMLGHLQALLEGSVAAPDRRLADLTFMSNSEWQELVITRNHTQTAYPADLCFHELFEAQVTRTPDAIAAFFEGVHLSYEELNIQANRLAHELHVLGVGPEVRVGICVERSLELVIGLLSIFKAGGAFVPLDPTFPKERMAFILADAQVSVLLTQQAIYDLRFTIYDLEESQTAIVNRKSKIVNLDADWLHNAPAENLRSGVRASNLAYLIYTSGSTGRPKGVLIPHRGLVNYLVWCATAYAAANGHGAPVQSSIAADAIFPSLFAPLIVGTTVMLLPEDQALAALDTALRNTGQFSLIKITPSQLELLNHLLPERDRQDWVRTLVVGAEEVLGEVLTFWQMHAPDTRVLNEYGPTETVVGCSMYEVPPGRFIRGTVPIGLPIANTQFYVLDGQMRPVPIGVVGELYIGGDGVAWGYHNRPDLTAERFVPNPFVGDKETRRQGDKETKVSAIGYRLYKTGDLVRYLADRAGNIEFLGRIDDQVKLLGYRVEPGEVAAVLMQHPAVREAVVLAHADVPGDKRLVAYIVPAETQNAERRTIQGPEWSSSSFIIQPSALAGELRSFLKERLPNYMVPSAFVLLEAIPLAPHGKIDRKALPPPEQTRPALESTFAAPRSPIEEVLAQIWSDVLRIEQVGIHDNFFSLGGHSLIATQMVARARAAFHVELPLRGLFEAPTVAELARRIMALRRDAPQSLPPLLVPASRDRLLPLSFAQQRLWFLNQLEPDSPAYNMPAAMRFAGLLDVAALERSLNMIVQRHEALRTTFGTLDDQPVQEIRSSQPVSLGLIDLQVLRQHEPENEVLRLAAEDARRPFDLAHGPLLRTTLLRLAEDTHVLLLTMHHIVTDGWSVGVFMHELVTLYAAFTTGMPVPLPRLPIQYADYALWQRNWLQGTVREEQMTYWCRKLADLAVLALPTDAPRPAIQSFQGAAYEFAFPSSLSQALVALSRQQEVTVFMTLLAGWQALLARYSGQDDIAVGTPIANRTYEDIEGLIGCFVNTLVLRTAVTGSATLQALLEQVREVCLEAYTHQDLPFEQLVDALEPARDLSRQPLFQVLFVLQNTPPVDLQLPGLTVEPLEIEYGIAKFDLSLFLGETETGLTGVLQYCTDLFAVSSIERMARHFQTLLENIVAQPEQRLAEIPLLTQAERQQILVEWNATSTEFSIPHSGSSRSSDAWRQTPDSGCIHHLFELQVIETPDRIAAVFEDAQISYRELNAHANQLAHYLQRLRVAPEVRVGICMERSLELIVGLLGILKAGGVYVPLDPTYPTSRLAFMLMDAQVPVLLTQRHLVERLPNGKDAGHRPTTVDEGQAAKDEYSLTNGIARFHSPTPRPQPFVVCLDTDWTAIAREQVDNLASTVAAENLAYVIYTSGSTGQPKGAMNTHRGICNRLLWMQEAYGLTVEDCVLQKTSFSFDISVWEFFWPLLNGARLVLARPDGHQDIAYLIELIATQYITTLHFVPSMLRVFVEEYGLGVCTALRRVICSGEALPIELQERFFTRLDAALHNLYGPTEAAIDVTAWACLPSRHDRTVPIGRSIANTQIYLLDQCLQPVPVGVPGELFIGGIGLARGYLNRPDLTAERFVPNPFATLNAKRETLNEQSVQRSATQRVPGVQRLYRTGDLARYQPDGAIEFLRRIDHQVKLRGFRIEPGEVEALIRQHPLVRDAVVVVREDAPDQRRLVAYVVEGSGVETARRAVSTPDPQPLIPDLRAFLAERLPAYMLPAAFVVLEALPLTVHDKVDRRALPAPEDTRSNLDDTFVAPRTLVEQTLAAIWAKVLRRARVGVHDNFFTLGGDSILGLQVVARARQSGLQLIPRQLFQHQTIAALAAVADTPADSVAEQGLVAGPVPLTPIQRWFFAQELAAPHHWNQAVLLAARAPLVPSLLERALHHLLAHHDALRLRFERTVAGWQQTHVAGVPPTPLLCLDLTALDMTAQPAALAASTAGLQASLDLAQAPLVRAALFYCHGTPSQRLLLILHHLIVDTVSWGILLEDLYMVYTQLQQGAAVQLPPKTTAFRTWAERLVAYAQTDALWQEVPYWQHAVQLLGTRLPVDLGGTVNTVAAAREVMVTLGAAATRTLLHEIPPVYRTQINDVLLTALVQAFAAWTGQATLLIDLEGHGREIMFDDVDLTRTVGWFTTLFPVLLDLRGVDGPGAAVQAIKEQLRAIPQRGLGYGVLRYLREDAAVVAELAGLPVAEVRFNYLGQLDLLDEANGLFDVAVEASGPTQSPLGQRSHLLDVIGFVRDGQLQVSWIYSAAVYTRTTVERLAQGYIAALQALIAHCQDTGAGGYTPSDFPLTRVEQHELDMAFEEVEFEGE
jgi:amino acid adenylation domain-containing protein/non-ribosomal peptide synthase protein (TIGR01720 family)